MTATITFSDHTTIEAGVNGNCYFIPEKPEFPSDLSLVIVEKVEDDQTITEEFHNVRIVEPYAIDDNYWFAFHEMSAQEIWQASIEDAICELSEVM